MQPVLLWREVVCLHLELRGSAGGTFGHYYVIKARDDYGDTGFWVLGISQPSSVQHLQNASQCQCGIEPLGDMVSAGPCDDPAQAMDMACINALHSVVGWK